ncbi:MAG: NlpC/P60 family protein, partial [Clostridia bacterium]|nr:NlpC/P60 family protein [Clostridia bacterium]
EPTFTPTPSPTPDTDKAQQLCDYALTLLGQPYVRGGDNLDEDGGFDPGGFVYHCLNYVGESVSRRTSAGYSEVESWTLIESISELAPGDLLFFMTGTNTEINCVCIYLGDDRMIYPSSSELEVITTRLSSDYWTNGFVLARRVF